MITLREWDKCCRENLPLYHQDGDELSKFDTKGVAVVYDKNMKNYVIWNDTSFNELFLDEKEGAKFIIKNIQEKYL